MALPFIAQLLIGIALNVIGYLLMPKPKQPKPPALEDLEMPTQETGRPIPVVFGTITISGLNILWYGDEDVEMRTTGSSKK